MWERIQLPYFGMVTCALVRMRINKNFQWGTSISMFGYNGIVISCFTGSVWNPDYIVVEFTYINKTLVYFIKTEPRFEKMGISLKQKKKEVDNAAVKYGRSTY